MVFRYFKAEMLQQYLEMATLNEFRGNVHFEKEHFLNFTMNNHLSAKQSVCVSLLTKYPSVFLSVDRLHMFLRVLQIQKGQGNLTEQEFLCSVDRRRSKLITDIFVKETLKKGTKFNKENGNVSFIQRTTVTVSYW